MAAATFNHVGIGVADMQFCRGDLSLPCPSVSAGNV